MQSPQQGHGFPNGAAPQGSNSPQRRRPRTDSTPTITHDSTNPAKRMRSLENSPSLVRDTNGFGENNMAETMSAKALGKRPLYSSSGSNNNDIYATTSTRPVALAGSNGLSPSSKVTQRRAGARRLVIKNLRVVDSGVASDTAQVAANPVVPPVKSSVELYLEKTWRNLESALDDMLAGEQPTQPMVSVYTGIEDICRRGGKTEAAKVFRLLVEKCEAHMRGVVKGRITSDAGSGSGVEVLRSVMKQWKVWGARSITIRSAFSYLDRTYNLKTKDIPEINDLLIRHFRRMLFGPGDVDVAQTTNDVSHTTGNSMLEGMCDLVEFDRIGDARFDGTLLRDAITMMHVCNRYGPLFEPRFLGKSHEYLLEFAQEKSASCNLTDYVVACEKLLQREDYRCNVYNFDSTTKQQLLQDARYILIEQHAKKLLDLESVGALLSANSVSSMKGLHGLLKLSGMQAKLKTPWETYIRKTGSDIVCDKDRSDEMVIELLKLRRALDVMVRDAFDGEDVFTRALRESFAQFINDKGNNSSWGTGTSKVGEMIAKYADMLLRGGIKTLPGSLISDTKDRAAAERSGQASTGDEDAELDRQLDHAIELFRFIEGKDVFEAFYKKDLARRLLMGRSASQDAERNMLAKLKSECGSSFTHNLEQMFKDMSLAKEEMSTYKEWRDSQGVDGNTVDLGVNILSAAAWPSYPDVKMLLPEEAAKEVDKFDRYYKNKHTGRVLHWKHNLATCSLKARFNKGLKELAVSGQQALCLMLFNKQPTTQSFLSYDDIAQGTGLTGGELDRTLQSLACGKVRVLTKHPKGRDVNPTDTFTVNLAFSDPKFKVKINQIQLKETKEENKETHQRVSQDRQFETQAAIVRIMKSRKTMTHSQLVAEVINQTKSRGAVDTMEIKKNIEKLIEKEYLEREGGSYHYQA